MKPMCVVVHSPAFDQHLCFEQRVKDLPIEQLASLLGVRAIAKSFVVWGEHLPRIILGKMLTFLLASALNDSIWPFSQGLPGSMYGAPPCNRSNPCRTASAVSVEPSTPIAYMTGVPQDPFAAGNLLVHWDQGDYSL